MFTMYTVQYHVQHHVQCTVHRVPCEKRNARVGAPQLFCKGFKVGGNLKRGDVFIDTDL